MAPSRVLAPRYWGFHLLALVLVGIAAGLGWWQADAWSQRREAEAADLTRVEPVPLADVLGPDDPFPGDRVGQPVVLEGTWLPEGTLFVSGRELDGQDGYWVVTPLEVPDGAAVLVVRGWTAELAQAPPPPTGAAELVAWLQPGEGTGAVDDDPDDDVLPQLRVADALQRLDRDLYGAYAVVADEVAPGDWPSGDDAVNDGTAGLGPATLDQLPPVGRFTALRNLLYAVEWWVFGAFAAFIWWRWLRDELDASVDSAA
ncbi:SURF1 family protein [Nocardioides donggukensis]|uniref:SURF1-like protein n=1 Tax=Nocardioides donggukensis TaxID=2774019 RepID=A0A927K519_9ACTN|nr:SURF1 family protein [Nocardioides donggukensis]MBD8868001.1 SURF1 family protein [Nocardioides donggukensis]